MGKVPKVKRPRKAHTLGEKIEIIETFRQMIENQTYKPSLTICAVNMVH